MPYPDRPAACLGLLLASLWGPPAHGQQGYQKPPKAILNVLHAPPTPLVSVSPARERGLAGAG